MKIDLHSHSTCSDGKESVAEVFHQAKLAGVDVLALTDHDTTHGWAEAASAAAHEGIGFVPGIEVTTRAHVFSPSGELHKFGVHMLAYLPDPNHVELAEVLAESVTSRETRLRAIVVREGSANDLVKRASLLRRDSVHGPFAGTITVDADKNLIIANDQPIQVIYANDPSAIDYTAYGINDAIIVDNTGRWRDEPGLRQHLAAQPTPLQGRLH